MSKPFPRIIPIVLACCLLLAACAPNNAPATSAEQSSTAASATPAEASAAPSASAPAQDDGKLINEGDPIHILVGYAPFDAKTDHSVVVLEEVTHYDIDYDMLPEQNALDKLNLIFSSGDIPYDLINIGASDNDKSVYATYAKKNLLLDLTDELPKYPNLSKLDPLGADAVRVNGRIFAIGSTGMPYSSDTISVRMDWLEKLGLSVPTTRDEFYNMLVQFQQKDPGGIGADFIPFIAGPGTMVSTVATTFGILYDYQDVEGKLADMRLTQEYKAYLTFMNKLYSEKLMDQDMPVNTGTTISEKVAAGRVGAFSGGTDQPRFLWVAAKEKNKDIAAPMDIIAPFKDDKGVQRSRSLSGLFRIGMVPKSSTKLETTLKFLDAFRDDKNYEYIIHGDEGVDFKMVDGEPTPLIPAFDQNRGNLYHLSPLQDGPFYFPLWKMRTRKTAEGGYLFAKTFEKAGDFLVVNPLAAAPAFDSVSQDIKVVTEYAAQEATKFIAGARSLDEFDQFVTEMKSKGADKIVEAYNEWYKGTK